MRVIKRRADEKKNEEQATVMKHTPVKIIIAMLLTIATFGQSFIFAQTDQQTLSATANFKAEEAITSESAIEISLSRVLTTGERVAVIIGEIDLTGLFALPAGSFTSARISVRTAFGGARTARYGLPVEDQPLDEELHHPRL